MTQKSFKPETLTAQELEKLEELGKLCRGDILKMTTLAESGHPGGSMSSVDIYLVLYSYANLENTDPFAAQRDRIIVSHGHTSPAVYSVLGRLNFVDLEETIATFRQTGSPYEGHIVRDIPGIEWSTGNLGQGLSAGCGMATAAKVKGENWNVLVAMSDGEQAKGQVAEARRFAKKFKLTNLSVIIDYNNIQISGKVCEVMPQNIKEGYEADGWKTLEIDGHNYQQIYQALRQAVEDKDNLYAILASTTIGKGVSFMEGECSYHGKALSGEEFQKALQELNLENDLDKYKRLREKYVPSEAEKKRPQERITIDVGKPHTYSTEEKKDNRGAFGQALKEIAEANLSKKDATPMVVLDCDLASSVKTDAFAKILPPNFYQGGVQEHNTATIAGALSTQGVIAFFADFGVFGVDETYNQHRLNDMNHTNLKVICTHCGLDVGEDGKTHQCIDYLGVFRNLYAYKVIVPADPNQTDRAIRYLTKTEGNFLVVMGRSKLPVVLDKQGHPYFGENYEFRYGKADILREGEKAAIITMGTLVGKAVQISETLAEKGCSVKVVNVSCPIDIDRDAVKQAAKTGLVVTYEDHHRETGLGSIVAQVIAEEGIKTKLLRLGVEHYGESGKSAELYKIFGLDEESVEQKILTYLTAPNK